MTTWWRSAALPVRGGLQRGQPRLYDTLIKSNHLHPFFGPHLTALACKLLPRNNSILLLWTSLNRLEHTQSSATRPPDRFRLQQRIFATAHLNRQPWLTNAMARSTNFTRSNSSSSSSDGESIGHASRRSMSSSRAHVKASCYLVKNTTMVLEGFHYTTGAPGVGW